MHTLVYSGLLEELVEILEMSEGDLVEIKAAALRTLTSITHLERTPNLPKYVQCPPDLPAHTAPAQRVIVYPVHVQPAIVRTAPAEPAKICRAGAGSVKVHMAPSQTARI